MEILPEATCTSGCFPAGRTLTRSYRRMLDPLVHVSTQHQDALRVNIRRYMLVHKHMTRQRLAIALLFLAVFIGVIVFRQGAPAVPAPPKAPRQVAPAPAIALIPDA